MAIKQFIYVHKSKISIASNDVAAYVFNVKALCSWLASLAGLLVHRFLIAVNVVSGTNVRDHR